MQRIVALILYIYYKYKCTYTHALFIEDCISKLNAEALVQNVFI